MRHASYLTTSRHGIDYFRWPVPPSLHPDGRRTDVKVSTGTRCPKRAREVSRYLAVAGQSRRLRATLTRMRYDEVRQHVREHFRDLLGKHRASVAKHGPASSETLEGVETSVRLAEGATPEEWADLLYLDGPDGLLREFCDQRGIPEPPTPEARQWMLHALHTGYRANLSGVLDFQRSLDSMDLHDEGGNSPEERPTGTSHAAPGPALQDAVDAYLGELERTRAVTAKTILEKRDALDLMIALTPETRLASLTKADARGVRDALMRLPKNRTKLPQTRNLSLPEMLALENFERVSPVTVNGYLGNMQAFGKWATDQGYIAENIYSGMRVKVPKARQSDERGPFSQDQLRTIFQHLTEDPAGIVKKEDRKWVCLIAMFSGMRLDEVAQLDVADIAEVDGVWVIDVNANKPQKHLKNDASRRRVPVHDTLLACGLLDFIDSRRRSERLFPSLPYNAKSGTGRNVGRWFNETFLPKLDMKSSQLVFHSFRHSVSTHLGQTDVPGPKVSAILGHRQSGVTYNSYFREGFLPHQLQIAINRFDF